LVVPGTVSVYFITTQKKKKNNLKLWIIKLQLKRVSVKWFLVGRKNTVYLAVNVQPHYGIVKRGAQGSSFTFSVTREGKGKV